MEEIATQFSRMQQLEPQVYIYGPATEEAIRHLENAFGDDWVEVDWRQMVRRLLRRAASSGTSAGQRRE